jgi:hypothetical protein
MDYNDVIAGRANNTLTRRISKVNVPSLAANNLASLWKAPGDPTAGTTPTTTYELCTSSTTGALSLPSLSSGYYYYLDRLSHTLVSAYAQRIILYDRLSHVGGYSGTVTSTQSNAIALTGLPDDRLGAADYSEVQWLLEWYTATGATQRTATISYTNGAGTSGRSTTVVILSSSPAYRMYKIIGANGEAIQSIQSITLDGSTLTAGNFGIVAVRELSSMYNAQEPVICTPIDWLQCRLPKISDEACLFIVWHSLTPSGNADARLQMFSSNAT